MTCAGMRCTFDASGSTDDTGIVTYEWDFGDAAVASITDSSTSHRFPLALGGQFEVRLTVVDGAGQQDQIVQSLEVLALEKVMPIIKGLLK